MDGGGHELDGSKFISQSKL